MKSCLEWVLEGDIAQDGTRTRYDGMRRRYSSRAARVG